MLRLGDPDWITNSRLILAFGQQSGNSFIYCSMAFDRDAIINQLYTSPEVDAAISKMNPAELREELKQEMFLVLCNLPEDRLKAMHEGQYIKWFLVRTMTNMIQSDRSAFYNTHRRYREKILSGSCWLSINGEIEAEGLFMEATEIFYATPGFRPPSVFIEGHIHGDDIPLTEKVQEAIADIDPYEAALIQLYADMGGTCKPIAQATGISERGVRFAVAKAREKLQKKLRA